MISSAINVNYFDYWNKIFHRYLVAVSDVLTSVQKTEESLKRLRKDRTTTTSTGISDDDKIRMQLVIDVDAFVEQSTCLLEHSPPEMKALRDVVEPARQVFRRSPPASNWLDHPVLFCCWFINTIF